jgi:hypothetical protein
MQNQSTAPAADKTKIPSNNKSIVPACGNAALLDGSRVEITSQQTQKKKSCQHANGNDGRPIRTFSWFHCLTTIATGANLIDAAKR